MVENTELVLYIGGGLWAFKEFVVPLVKGSFGRNLQQVDEHTKKVDAMLDDHEKRLVDLKGEQKGLSLTLTSELGNIAGKLSGLDTRIAEQGKFHDQKLTEALNQMSTDFNRKLSSTLNSELERTVREVLSEMLPKRKR